MNATQILWNWILLCASIWMGRISFRSWQGKLSYYHYRRLRNAAETYVETGRKIAPFHSFTGTALQAVEKRRVDRIRQKDSECGRFSAWTTCPACDVEAVHGFDSVFVDIVVRQCNSCGHEWKQN